MSGSELNEFRYLISTQMFLQSYGIEFDLYDYLVELMGYKQMEIFQGPTSNLR